MVRKIIDKREFTIIVSSFLLQYKGFYAIIIEAWKSPYAWIEASKKKLLQTST